jgi:hypothetical protein
MSEVGYYRYKVKPTAEGSSAVKLYINGTLASTATVVAKEFCPGFMILKYIDSSGRYRFFPFNDKWQRTDKPKSIGEVNKFITSILDSQADAEQIGYKNDRTISLTAGRVSVDDLEKLSDIYTSPRVYLYVGSGSNDRIQDWIQVTVSGDGVGRRRNNKFSKVSIDVKLPEYYAITKV